MSDAAARPDAPPPAGHLDVHAVVRRDHAGPATLDAAFTAGPGDVVAVIGPNGAGKTTLLRAVAGLVRLDAGHVACGGRTWDDGHGHAQPVHRRHVGMVFQRQLLLPHLDARANVAYPLRTRGVRRAAARRTAEAWLHRLGVATLAGRRPHEMSGGQAQRVAIARALAPDPDVLLLDEPLAGLDAGVANALRFELAQHLQDFGGVTVLVTHDAVDTLTLATRVVVLDEGRVVQTGTPEEVTGRPAGAHVAALVGLNVLRGESTGTDVELPEGAALVTAVPVDGPVVATFSPAAVSLTLEEPTGSARNRWSGVVRSVVPVGTAVRVHVDAGGVRLAADVTAGSVDRLGLSPGVAVWAAVKATEIDVHGTARGREAPLGSRHV